MAGDGEEVLFDDLGVCEEEVLLVALQLSLQEVQEVREVFLNALQLRGRLEGLEESSVEREALLDGH